MSTIKNLSLLLIGILLLSCGKSNAVDKPAPVKNKLLRIVSYNIHHGTPINSASGAVDLNNIAKVIKAQNPDLVALQEVDKNTKRAGLDEAKVLAEQLGMSYFFSKSINYDGGEYGIAVLSKYPVLASERIELSNEAAGGEQRTVAIVTVEIPDFEKIRFACAHLDLVLENRTAQIGQLNDLSKASQYPLLVAGDFNTTPDSPEIALLKKEFSLGCTTNCALTFPADKPAKTIDYIVLNPAAAKKLTVKSYNAVAGQLASDHLPLLGVYTY
ncbi:endonuclease/exonuclease/phosphatase family protein [Pedobacter sp. BS3]|uniref:endonuclease/exonuclease/phosphatase family protein n=1 Tax=Pedobacter sp. BS3 TaxID=2567937 RepID=UPI001F5B6C60|nr:endonuclease/exonuclease/phosphatase family protein [Pedobacter sp. BS3]